MKGFERWITALVIGSVEFGVLLLVFGDTTPSSELNLFQLFAMSVLCTFGISLIFIWGPLVLIMGAATLMLVDRLPREKAEAAHAQTEGRRQRPAPPTAEENLARYVERMRAAGMSPDELRARLRKAGWDEATVEEALQQGVGEGQGVAKL